MMNFDAYTYEAMYGAGGEMRDITPEFCEKMRRFGVNPWATAPIPTSRCIGRSARACP